MVLTISRDNDDDTPARELWETSCDATLIRDVILYDGCDLEVSTVT